MNSSNETQSSLQLSIKGVGHICGKKNRHYAAARGRLLIDKKTAEKVERITRAIVFQLLSKCQTTGGATSMECLQLSQIVSLMPEDDSWQWICEENIKGVKVKPGEEGAEILIERIG